MSALGSSVRAGACAAAALGLGALLAGRLPWPAVAGIAVAVGWLVHRHIKKKITVSLVTAESVVGAIRSGNYGFRARHAAPGEPIAQLLYDLNDLGQHLRREHLRMEETTALLHAIVARTEVALLAFDGEGVLKWTNPATDRLFPHDPAAPVTAAALGIEHWFTCAPETIVSIPGQPVQRSWQLHRGTLWLERRRYTFFMVVDGRRVGREQERLAWQRLIRVIGHEVNNTLAPLQSLANTCLGLLRDAPQSAGPSVERALTVIEQRAHSLHRFIGEYTKLARLPPLRFRSTRLADCIETAVHQEDRGTVRVLPGPEVVLELDPTQLEQALVNVIRNAVEATQATGGTTSIQWVFDGEDVIITIVDEGAGIQNPENLFVPFFSTKPSGSGIGLALSRNIVEGHGGELTIANRSDRSGCIVRIRLPLKQPDSAPPRRDLESADVTDQTSQI